MNKEAVKKLLKSYNLFPSKRMGQNFLINERTENKIITAADLSKNDVVLEIGSGIGNLTLELAKKSKEVLAVEKDKRMIKALKDLLKLNGLKNVRVVSNDVLKINIQDFSLKNYKVVGNIPYYLTSRLIRNLLEAKNQPKEIVLMLQKEVADRLTAQVGTKDYGVLTVLLGTCATVESIMHLGPGQFHPRPKVDSTVVRIDFKPAKNCLTTLAKVQFSLLKAIVKSSFQQRRKTLLNALQSSGILGLSKDDVRELIIQAGISPTTRPDKLTIDDYIEITRAYTKRGV